MNSRKMAESTGWLPPVPRPMKAHSVAMPTKLGLPAPIKPAKAEMKRVTLKAGRRPMKSAVSGQTVDPTTKPAYFPTVRKAILETLNSAWIGGLMMVIACSQN
jgi:hypothetical protein